MNEKIKQLLSNPEKIALQETFYTWFNHIFSEDEVTSNIGEKVKASLPNYNKKIVSQETFMAELDPNSHKVLFDENIPSICQKD